MSEEDDDADEESQSRQQQQRQGPREQLGMTCHHGEASHITTSTLSKIDADMSAVEKYLDDYQAHEELAYHIRRDATDDDDDVDEEFWSGRRCVYFYPHPFPFPCSLHFFLATSIPMQLALLFFSPHSFPYWRYSIPAIPSLIDETSLIDPEWTV